MAKEKSPEMTPEVAAKIKALLNNTLMNHAQIAAHLARIIHRDGVVLGFRVGSPGVTGCGRC